MSAFTHLTPADAPVDLMGVIVEVGTSRLLESDEPSDRIITWEAKLKFDNDFLHEWFEDHKLSEVAGGLFGDQVLARARISTLSLGEGLDALEALDAVGGDLAQFCTLVGRDGLVADLANEFVMFGDELAIVDRLLVAPAWRGLKLGQLLVAATFETLGDDAALYACLPGAFEVERGTPERLASDEALVKYWEELGFTHQYGDILLLEGATWDWSMKRAEIQSLAG